jgi:hypothetical protein
MKRLLLAMLFCVAPAMAQQVVDTDILHFLQTTEKCISYDETGAGGTTAVFIDDDCDNVRDGSTEMYLSQAAAFIWLSTHRFVPSTDVTPVTIEPTGASGTAHVLRVLDVASTESMAVTAEGHVDLGDPPESLARVNIQHLGGIDGLAPDVVGTPFIWYIADNSDAACSNNSLCSPISSAVYPNVGSSATSTPSGTPKSGFQDGKSAGTNGLVFRNELMNGHDVVEQNDSNNSDLALWGGVTITNTDYDLTGDFTFVVVYDPNTANGPGGQTIEVASGGGQGQTGRSNSSIHVPSYASGSTFVVQNTVPTAVTFTSAANVSDAPMIAIVRRTSTVLTGYATTTTGQPAVYTAPSTLSGDVVVQTLLERNAIDLTAPSSTVAGPGFRLAELIVYKDDSLSDTERDQLYQYLAEKYGIEPLSSGAGSDDMIAGYTESDVRVMRVDGDGHLGLGDTNISPITARLQVRDQTLPLRLEYDLDNYCNGVVSSTGDLTLSCPIGGDITIDGVNVGNLAAPEYIVGEANADLVNEVAPSGDNQTPISTGASAAAWSTIPLCTASQKTNFDGTAWVCATDDGASNVCSGTTTYEDGEGNCDTLDGVEDFETATDDGVIVGTGTVFDTKVVPACTDTGGNHLNYDAASNAFICGTTSSGGAGTMSSFNIDGDNNAPETVSDGQEVQLLGGTNGIDTVAGPTRTITFNFDAGEAEGDIELVVDLQDLQGAVTDAQVPNNITIDLATLATTVTVSDAGGDTTTFPVLAGNATGSLSMLTDPGLSYQATTNALTATTFIGALSGNATTATALAANGANCSAGNYPLGVDASGAVESCTADDDLPEVGDFTNLVGGVGINNNSGTLDFDATEIVGTTTWGGGASQTWIWNAGATDPTFVFGSDSIVVTNAAVDLGGTTSFEVPNGTNPTVDAAGELAQDTTDDQLLYGATPRVLSYRQVQCKVVENLAADDIDMPFWSPGPTTSDNITLVSAWCICTGTCTTEADITFEIRETGTASTVDAVGGTVDCEDEVTGDTATTLTSDNTVDGLDLIRFNVTNTPVPETDTYTICIAYTVDRR